jgi:hypothetical protein
MPSKPLMSDLLNRAKRRRQRAGVVSGNPNADDPQQPTVYRGGRGRSGNSDRDMMIKCDRPYC